MDRFSLSHLIARRWPIILVLTLVVFGATLGLERRKDPQYFGSFTVTVEPSRRYPETQQLILQPNQGEDLKTAVATTQSWIADPFYVRKALEKANVSVADMSLADYANIFQVISDVPFSRSYQVQYVGATQTEVENVFTALRSVLDEAQASFDSAKSDLLIETSYTDTTVTSHGSGVPLAPIAGLVIGLLFATMVAAAFDRAARK
ncbi:MAG TPA: hypothetical protein VLA04_05945 [Verrucomicrobiae bacterium]|nr:hypothetical protein [Verrucomicrobiae bacterium]